VNAFKLPAAISHLVEAKNGVRAHYESIIRSQGGQHFLDFTLDGKLVGDIGEAVAVELFGLRLAGPGAPKGVDGYAPDGRTVQVKATGTKRGAVFRKSEIGAKHLLFFCLDFDNATGTIMYNGPEHLVTRHMLGRKQNQNEVSRKKIADEFNKLDSGACLPRLV